MISPFTCLLGLGIWLLTPASLYSQELRMPASVKTLPHGKCYWAYSVWREKTIRDSLHRYTIHVSISQHDSAGKPRGTVRIRGANIVCEWMQRGQLQQVHFVPRKDYWIATFVIHTNQVLPLDIVASYNGSTRRMSLKLNDAVFPGEGESLQEVL